MAEYITKEALRAFPIRANHYDGEHGNKHFISGIETVMEYAENLPAEDVAPVVHGRRIDYGGFYCRCSQCEGTLPVCSNYCPNCGARMDGGAREREERSR